jgi:integrase
MPTNSLSDAKCKTAKPKEKGYKLFDGHGLFLLVTPAGGKLWKIAYRVDGKQQTASIGSYPLLSLADARQKRDELRLALLNGESLKPAKKKEVLTLAQACGQYWEGRKDITDGYRMNAINAMDTHVLHKLGSMPIADVKRSDVLEVLRVMDAAGLSVYVRKVRIWLGQVFDWAIEHEQAKDNPCSSIDPKKAFSAAKVESFAALELGEMHDFMRRLDLEGAILSAVACRMIAFTWARTQEVRMMEWGEIDGDMWRIPAGKMKRRRDHMVPLPRQAMELLDNLRARSKGSKYVFPNDRRLDRPMSENAVLYLLGRIGYGKRMTGHGFRTVASTWANENGFNPDAIERQLAHVPDNKVRAVYNRAEFMDDRRKAVQAYADWLTGYKD